MGEEPGLEFGFHDNRTLVSVMSEGKGFEGGPGKVEGSGVLWKTTEGSVCASTISTPDLVVSPVSLDALQVYIPLSDFLSSEDELSL